MKYTLKTVTFRAAEPQGPSIDGPTAAVRILHELLDGLDQDREHFIVLALNCRGRTIGYQVVATGTATSCLVHPREVFRGALALGAHAIIVAHNHPSNDVEPSLEDMGLTRRLIDSGEILGIPVVDSIVITANGDHRSMVEA